MSIEYMTTVSHLLLSASGAFAAVAAVLFFWLDIPKCWRLVLGKVPARKPQLKADRVHMAKNKSKERKGSPGPADRCEATLLPGDVPDAENEPVKETLLLDDRMGAEYKSDEKTVLLYGGTVPEQTALLGTEDLELIQDIVYMQEKRL